MTRNDKPKDLIAEELAKFLLSEKSAPSEVSVTVVYANARARLEIPACKIVSALEDTAP